METPMNLNERFFEMNQLLQKIAAEPDGDRLVEVKQYLKHSFHIDRMKPSGPSPERNKELNNFLRKTAPLVQECARTFDVDGGEAVRLFMQQEFVGNDWITLCLRRSHIEAFNDLYNHIIPKDDLIYTEELDDNIRKKAKLEALPDPDRIPSGLPDSHWWWKLG